jgi:hypothetical protein
MGSGGIAVLFSLTLALDANGWSTLAAHYPEETDQVPIVQEAGWAPGPVWMAAENLILTRIQFPDSPNN